jgi:hypothetical protein
MNIGGPVVLAAAWKRDCNVIDDEELEELSLAGDEVREKLNKLKYGLWMDTWKFQLLRASWSWGLYTNYFECSFR